MDVDPFEVIPSRPLLRRAVSVAHRARHDELSRGGFPIKTFLCLFYNRELLVESKKEADGSGSRIRRLVLTSTRPHRSDVTSKQWNQNMFQFEQLTKQQWQIHSSEPSPPSRSSITYHLPAYHPFSCCGFRRRSLS